MAEEAGRLRAHQTSVPAALTGADLVIARDRDGRLVEDSPGLVAATARENAGEYLVQIHPQDRARLARAWSNATADPGRVHAAEAWTLANEQWVRRRFDFYSGLDDPDLGVVLIGVTDLVADRGTPAKWEVIAHPQARWSILRLGPMGDIRRAEGMVEELYGRTARDLIGSNGLDLIHPDDHESLLDAWADVVENDVPGRALRQRVISLDGTVTWVLGSIGRPDAEGEITVHDLDITDQLDAEEALRASEARFRQLATDLPTGVFVTDTEGRFAFTNARCDDLIGPHASLLDLLPAAPDLDWRDAIASAAADGDAEFDCRVEGDRVLRVRCQRPLHDGTVCGVIEDVTTSRRWRDEAVTDGLTGLANRPALTRELERRIEAGERSLVAFIDLDGFKAVNDEHGHEEGDRVLRRVAAALRKMVRGTDVAGRWGGDEFILLIDDLPPDARVELRGRVDEAMIACGTGGASVGFTTLEGAQDSRSVIQRADRAMYEDKRRDRTTGGPRR